MATCCENPEPRVMESSGRIFCANCFRYLDRSMPRRDPIPVSMRPEPAEEADRDKVPELGISRETQDQRPG